MSLAQFPEHHELVARSKAAGPAGEAAVKVLTAALTSESAVAAYAAGALAHISNSPTVRG
jgi:hypothetical protein